jgi:hypothetical protein
MRTNRPADARSARALQTMRATFRSQVADRGYLCTFNALHNLWFIARDGQHIGSAGTLADCRATIDLLV